MPRFRDEWLLDRVLFDYVNGGACSCCSFALFLPGGTASLISGVSDIETDQATAEIAALSNHPWPQDLRDHVWVCRVKLRQRLKSDMNRYKLFWNTNSIEFTNWCRSNYQLLHNRLLQLPRSEIVDTLEHTYSVHSAYKAVIETVIEQVAYFHLTEYPTDGKGTVEINFENVLGFSRTGRGFYIDLVNESNNTLDEEVLQFLLDRIQSLGGPKLLERSTKNNTNENSIDTDNAVDDQGDDADGYVPTKASSSSTGKPSFESDRRIVRLIIARYWADLLIQRFLDDTERTSTNNTKIILPTSSS